MNRESIREYVARQRDRYQRGDRTEKGRIFDEVVAVTDYHRKSAVAHCGATVAGFHLWTVTAVDVATGWVEMDVVWGKTQERVGAAIRRMQRRLPVPLLGLDSDNGSGFINRGLYTYPEVTTT